MRSATRIIWPSIVLARRPVGHAHWRAGLPLRVLRDAVPNLPGEVQSSAVVLQHVHNPKALLVVVEAARNQPVDDPLPRVAKRRVPQIVAERDRLGELLVQAQHLGNRPSDLRDLERVSQPRSIVIAGRRKKDLRLVFQSPEGLAVNNPVPIALKRGTDVVFRLRPQATLRLDAPGGLRGQELTLACFELFANAQNRTKPGGARHRSGGRSAVMM